MAVIQSATGPLETRDLGFTLMHEHLRISWGGIDSQYPELFDQESELQRAVRFQVHSLVEPPPQPGSFDIILCRNVLLYFAQAMRRMAFTRLAEASAADGVLMLGAGETVIGQSDDFVTDPECRGLYLHSEPAIPKARAAS